MSRYNDLTGKRFGKLLVRGRAFPKARGTYWECQCDCGKITVVFAASLKRGSTKSCGCAKAAIGDLFRKRPYESTYNTLVRNLKGRELSISYEDFLEYTKIDKCHYCDDSIEWTVTNKPGGKHRYNLDRKDNTLGYTKDNVVVCCKKCNFGKTNAFGYAEWCEIGKAIKQFREGGNAT